MTKERVNIHISSRNAEMLNRATRLPGATKAAIVDKALDALFFPQADKTLEQRLLHRMDQLDLRQGEIEREVKVCVETLGHFVLYWLSIMEPIDDEDRIAAQAAGQRRFNYFINQVGVKIATNKGLSAKLLRALELDQEATSPDHQEPPAISRIAAAE